MPLFNQHQHTQQSVSTTCQHLSNQQPRTSKKAHDVMNYNKYKNSYIASIWPGATEHAGPPDPAAKCLQPSLSHPKTQHSHENMPVLKLGGLQFGVAQEHIVLVSSNKIDPSIDAAATASLPTQAGGTSTNLRASCSLASFKLRRSMLVHAGSVLAFMTSTAALKHTAALVISVAAVSAETKANAGSVHTLLSSQGCQQWQGNVDGMARPNRSAWQHAQSSCSTPTHTSRLQT